MRHEDSGHALLPEDNLWPVQGWCRPAQLLLTRGDGYKIILNMSPLSLQLLHVRHN